MALVYVQSEWVRIRPQKIKTERADALSVFMCLLDTIDIIESHCR